MPSHRVDIQQLPLPRSSSLHPKIIQENNINSRSHADCSAVS
jgi:hypothetical protein